MQSSKISLNEYAVAEIQVQVHSCTPSYFLNMFVYYAVADIMGARGPGPPSQVPSSSQVLYKSSESKAKYKMFY